ncbi:MAG: preprotein translocase subunit SecF [Actinomycetota bacterium]|jgi:preprotein translocase subunit SecF|nr:preprotein translocase subunit SecF [Actinomycetota bacterium]
MTGRLHRLYRGETNIDFIGRKLVWFALSGFLMVGSIALLFFNGLNYGIEFEGGISITAPIASDGPLADASTTDVEAAIRAGLDGINAGDAQIQTAEGDAGRSVIVQSKDIADPELQQEAVNIVADTVGATVEETDSQRIGSKWGGEITRKARNALVIFLLVILAFISWRFEWKMAIAAIAALAHDLLITAGVYSLVGFEVTPSTVIAILTILGYSLYDTVVVFDKVEENTATLASTGKMTYEDSANLSMNQVFMRSLNTSLATLLPVAALLFVGAGLLGATTLEDLSLALFVGILTGAYSSIFFATPVLTILKEHEPKYKNVREKTIRDAQRAEARVTPALAGAEVPTPGATSTSSASRPPRPAGGAAARARAGSKKAKRRKRR